MTDIFLYQSQSIDTENPTQWDQSKNVQISDNITMKTGKLTALQFIEIILGESESKI